MTFGTGVCTNLISLYVKHCILTITLIRRFSNIVRRGVCCDFPEGGVWRVQVLSECKPAFPWRKHPRQVTAFQIHTNGKISSPNDPSSSPKDVLNGSQAIYVKGETVREEAAAKNGCSSGGNGTGLTDEELQHSKDSTDDGLYPAWNEERCPVSCCRFFTLLERHDEP